MLPSPGRLRTETLPPWASTTAFTIARPEPDPAVAAVARAVDPVEAVEDARLGRLRDAVAAVAHPRCRSVPPAAAAPISIGWPGRVCCTAFSTSASRASVS